MSNILYTNVRILDGTGEHPYLGEVLVQGNRIRRVARGTTDRTARGASFDLRMRWQGYRAQARP